jgi:flagella basal body P-ring formation protein FlgA
MNMRFLLLVAFCAVAFSAYAQADANDVDVTVTAHDVARGDVLTADDLTTKTIPALRAGSSIVRTPADAVGKEARRALRAGELIRDSDLKHPTVVAKGATVTMVFETTGIQLTATGKALAEGGVGDSITVLNPTSYRQVVAEVIAPGTVRVNVRDGANIIPSQVAQSQP